MSVSQRLRNIKMSRKLATGFGLVLLLVAVSTLLSVQRFKEIRDVYQQTNLIYNINIEVFQAKINRLKFLYNGDEKSGQLMANYVRHAADLTAEAQQLEWTPKEKAIIDTIAGHLARFGSSVSEMQTAMAAWRADKNDQAATAALKAAEDKVKTAGDDSSAAIRDIIALVKVHNDSLAYSSSTITAIIGVVAVLFGILVSWWVTRQITHPVKHNLQLAERIASGDLSSDILPQGEDELGKLTGAMGRMNDKLRLMIGEVRSSVAQVSLAASEIAEGNTDLSSRTEQQAAAWCKPQPAWKS